MSGWSSLLTRRAADAGVPAVKPAIIPDRDWDADAGCIRAEALKESHLTSLMRHSIGLDRPDVKRFINRMIEEGYQ